MPRYYANKSVAIEAAKIAETDDRILYTKVEFEPYNGWVVVAVAKPRDLSDLFDEIEVRTEGMGRRLSPPPPLKRRGPPIAPPAPPRPSEGRSGPPARPGRKPQGEIIEAAAGERLVKRPWEADEPAPAPSPAPEPASAPAARSEAPMAQPLAVKKPWE